MSMGRRVAGGEIPDRAAGAPWQLSAAELLAELKQAAVALQRGRARWLGLLAEAERREASLTVHGTPTVGWLVDEQRLDARQVRDDLRFALVLEEQQVVSAAFAEGRVNEAQAKVLVAGLRRLPQELEAGQIAAVTDHLVALAGEFVPVALGRLVHHAVEVVAPEVAEEHDRRCLEHAEARQSRERFLSWRADPDGGWLLHGKLTDVAGEKLFRVLHALADRQRELSDELSRGQSAADALEVLADHASSCGVAPRQGADRPRVMVAVSLEALRSGLGQATLLGSDAVISAQQARVLACDADILPAVMGTRSAPLDLGRARRLFTSTLRQALIARDAGCVFPECDRRPAECEAHHIVAWHAGGRTSLANGVLLCGHHHRLVEPHALRPPEQQWQIRLGPTGFAEVAGPAGLEGRRWRQHHRFAALAA